MEKDTISYLLDFYDTSLCTHNRKTICTEWITWWCVGLELLGLLWVNAWCRFTSAGYKSLATYADELRIILPIP